MRYTTLAILFLIVLASCTVPEADTTTDDTMAPAVDAGTSIDNGSNIPEEKETEVLEEKELTDKQIESVEEKLNSGFSTAVSLTRIEVSPGEEETLAVGFSNIASSMNYFTVNPESGTAVLDSSGTTRPDLDVKDWVRMENYSLPVFSGENKIFPVRFHVPKDASSGEYTFSISVCYFKAGLTNSDSGCTEERKQRLGKTLKVYVDVP